ncbi:hypothetical protein KAT72_15760 [Aeromonas popoffii]|uniref:Uncharacterized protein n=1 Tax=Aeromonas popoffii TaxID=70856 RepID=A0ABS5GTG9_9GAMM|nr:hypothetical protein [Aeromonas popoffii]MBR7630435.1 hypothetical protein [Aeromonas popoffii]
MSIDKQTRQLAAIAYGEASTANVKDEISAIAWAVANRARAWDGKTVDELLKADPNYTYAVTDGNARYNILMESSEGDIAKDPAMQHAIDSAQAALDNSGDDLSNGAFWWDGIDFKTNFKNHPKVKNGFHITDPSHNIFDVKDVSKPTTIYWKVLDKKTKKIVDSKIRGKYEFVWESTAAYGKTIFWKHNNDYLKATGGKAYR